VPPATGAALRTLAPRAVKGRLDGHGLRIGIACAPSSRRSSALASAVREALLNVEKHAKADSVLVSLFRSASGGVTVTVYDDGIGPENNSKEGSGLGIASATDRLGRVGGRLVIGRNDDGGTTVRASVPA